MARYGQEFKSKVVARLLPPESAAVSEVAGEVGVSEATLERWLSQSLAEPQRERLWTSAARFDALLTTASLDEASRNAWCRSNGLYPQELAQWRQAAQRSLAEPGELGADARQDKQARRRIGELERELRRKEKALAETAALLVLSKKRLERFLTSAQPMARRAAAKDGRPQKKSRRSSAKARTHDRPGRSSEPGRGD